MSKEYTVKQFHKGDFQDNHGNYWCTMVLDGVGEQVRIVVKDPLQYEDGMKLYGDITEQTSKAGKQYLRFKKAERPEQTNDKPSEEYWEHKNATIRAQWAIGQSMTKFPEGCYEVSGADRITLLDNIKAFAKELCNMVDEVTGEDEQQEEVAKEVSESIDEGTPINLDDIPF